MGPVESSVGRPVRSERPFKEWPLLIFEEKIYNLLIGKPFVLLGIAIISPFDAQWNSSQYAVQHTYLVLLMMMLVGGGDNRYQISVRMTEFY